MGVEKSPIKIAFFQGSAEGVEKIQSSLRNLSWSARVSAFKNTEDIGKAIHDHMVDLVIVDGLLVNDLDYFLMLQEQHGGFEMTVVVEDLTLMEYTKFISKGVRSFISLEDKNIIAKNIIFAFQELQFKKRGLRAIDKIAQMEQRSEVLLETTSEPVAYLVEGLHIKANQAYVEMLGHSSFEDIEGLSLLDLVQPHCEATVKDKLKRLGNGQGKKEEMQVEFMTGAGTPLKVPVVFAPAIFEEESCLQIIIKYQWQSPSSESAQEDRLQSIKDPETGFLSRAGFFKHLESQKEGAHSVWLLGVNQQDEITEKIGMIKLDEWMRLWGQWVQEFWPGAKIGRWSNGLLAISVIDAAASEKIDELLIASKKKFIEIKGLSLGVELLTAGVLGSVENIGLDTLVEKLALGWKNARSQNQSKVVFDPQQDQKAAAAEVAQKIQAIREALENQKLTLLYQPVISMQSDWEDTYEVLLNIKDPIFGGPAQFITLAQSYGLGDQVDEWILNQMIHLSQNSKKSRLIVKLTANALANPQKTILLLRSMEQSGLGIKQLWIEMPGALVQNQIRQARELRDGLHQIGSHLLISQVMSIHMNAIEHVEPHWIKIHRDVIEGIHANPEKQEHLKIISEKSRQSHAKIMIPFVQDVNTMTYFFMQSVDAMQGHFISAPLEKMSFDFKAFGG